MNPASRHKFLILSRHVVLILHDFAPAHRHIIILSQLMDHFHGYVVVKMACKVFLLNVTCTFSCNTLITPRVAVLSRIQPLSQGRLCSFLKKVTWLHLVTCLLDYYRFHYVNWREGLEGLIFVSIELICKDLAASTSALNENLSIQSLVYQCTGYPKILKDLVTLGLQSRMLSLSASALA